MTFLEICNWATVVCSWIIGFIVLNWVIVFYKLRTTDIISKRKPKICLIIGIWTVVYFLWERPIFILYTNSKYRKSLSNIPGSAVIFIAMFWCIATPIIQLMVYRAFIVFIDIKFLKALEDQEWRSHLNPNETNYYLKHRRRLTKIIQIVLFGTLAFFALSGIILNGIDPNTLGGLNIVFVFLAGQIPLILNIIILCKIPKFNDFYGIRKEIKILLITNIGGYSLYFIITILVGALATGASGYNVAMLAYGIMGIMYIFMFDYIIFYRTFKLFNLPSNIFQIQSYLSNQKDISLIEDAEQIHPQISNQNSISKSNVLTLKNTLNNNEYFNLFARHLSHSWSLENLLFFVETQQFLLLLIKTYSNINTKDDQLINISLAKSVPSSIIVNIDNNDNDIFYEQSVKIFQKYVPVASDFAINLSSNARNNLINMFHNKNELNMIKNIKKNTDNEIQKLFTIFSESRTEIYGLLRSLFMDFKATESLD